jgi:hypothetical protein
MKTEIYSLTQNAMSLLIAGKLDSMRIDRTLLECCTCETVFCRLDQAESEVNEEECPACLSADLGVGLEIEWDTTKFEEESDNHQRCEVRYGLEALVPPERSLSKQSYWTEVKMLNQRLHTSSYEEAVLSLQAARETFGKDQVRLVCLKVTPVIPKEIP